VELNGPAWAASLREHERRVSGAAFDVTVPNAARIYGFLLGVRTTTRPAGTRRSNSSNSFLRSPKPPGQTVISGASVIPLIPSASPNATVPAIAKGPAGFITSRWLLSGYPLVRP
jgi:hypothetical protein